MPKPKIAIIVRDGVVDMVVSNDEIDVLILDYDDIMDEDVAEELEKTLDAASQVKLPEPGDPDAELKVFLEAGNTTLERLKG